MACGEPERKKLEAWRIGWGSLFRLGWRSLRRRPTFAALCILTIGLGVGASTAVFTILYGALLRPLPYRDPDSLVVLRESCAGSRIDRAPVSFPNFEEWSRETREFEGLAASQSVFVSLSDGAEAERIAGARVSAATLRILGRRPLLGREFLAAEEEPGRGDVALLGHGLWERRFGGDSKVVGRTVVVDGRRVVVVGVLPPGLAYPSSDTDLWIPFAPQPAERHRANHFLRVVGRLRKGVPLARAAAEVNTIAARRAELYPDSNRGWTVSVDPLAEALVGGARKSLLWVQGASLLLLLIACVNVASLFLVRAIGRRTELETLAALGAGRGRLVARLLAENLVAGVPGGVAGLGIAALCLAIARKLGPDRIPRVEEASLDGHALLFAAVLCLLTALASGLLPALRAAAASRGSLGPAARSTAGVATGRALDLLVVVEVALALALLAGAGLALRSFALASRVSPGFDPEGVQTITVGLPVGRLPDPRRHADYYRQALERLRALPQLDAVAVAGRLPLARWSTSTTFVPRGHPFADGEEPDADYVAVSPDFFRVLGVPLRDGRNFSDRDDAAAPFVVIVNERLARQFWPGRSAVGKALQVSADAEASRWREVVGVVADVRLHGLDSAPGPAIYVPLPQNTFPGHLRRAAFLFRARGGDGVAEVRQELRRYDRELGLSPVLSMDRVVSESLAPRRLVAAPLAVFAGLASLLAAVGIGSVLAYSVAQRQREFGVRLALGATAGGLASLVARRAAVLLAAGAAGGLALALSLSRLISGSLFGVSALDPAVYGGVVGVVGLMGALAAVLPAWRAARLDPVEALQQP